MAGLIEVTGRVIADVYIHRETRVPVRLVLTQPETVTTENPEPTTWTIDVFDLDAPSEIVPPSDMDSTTP
jgi:hypothetical protein